MKPSEKDTSIFVPGNEEIIHSDTATFNAAGKTKRRIRPLRKKNLKVHPVKSPKVANITRKAAPPTQIIVAKPTTPTPAPQPAQSEGNPLAGIDKRYVVVIPEFRPDSDVNWAWAVIDTTNQNTRNGLLGYSITRYKYSNGKNAHTMARDDNYMYRKFTVAADQSEAQPFLDDNMNAEGALPSTNEKKAAVEDDVPIWANVLPVVGLAIGLFAAHKTGAADGSKPVIGQYIAFGACGMGLFSIPKIHLQIKSANKALSQFGKK